MNIWDKVDELIQEKEDTIQEIDAWLEDDFDPCDASGGNFDDAYQLGHDHGYAYGYLAALKRVKKCMQG